MLDISTTGKFEQGLNFSINWMVNQSILLGHVRHYLQWLEVPARFLPVHAHLKEFPERRGQASFSFTDIATIGG